MVAGPGKARSWYCDKAAYLVSQSLDRRLSWLERAQLALHLTFCRLWARPQKELAWMRRLLRHDVEETAGASDSGAPTLSQEARLRIKNTLKESLRKERSNAEADERRE